MARRNSNSAPNNAVNLSAPVSLPNQPQAAGKTAVLWTVYDDGAAPGKTRAHEIILEYRDGVPHRTKTYKLGSDEELGIQMIPDHAMKFLKDKQFRVIDEKGGRVAPLDTKTEADLGNTILPADQCIAHLSELTEHALYRRCKTYPGSEVVTEKTKKPAMIKFIETTVRQMRRIVQRKAVDKNGNAIDHKTPEEIERMGLS
jgi:hypothetical protein